MITFAAQQHTCSSDREGYLVCSVEFSWPWSRWFPLPALPLTRHWTEFWSPVHQFWRLAQYPHPVRIWCTLDKESSYVRFLSRCSWSLLRIWRHFLGKTWRTFFSGLRSGLSAVCRGQSQRLALFSWCMWPQVTTSREFYQFLFWRPAQNRGFGFWRA